MGIVKLSNNKSAVLFVSDDGVMYSLPVNSMKLLLDGKVTVPFSKLIRLAYPAAPDRFPLSNVFFDNKVYTPEEFEVISLNLPKDLNITYDYIKLKQDKQRNAVFDVKDVEDW
jgi:hypothetical protein